AEVNIRAPALAAHAAGIVQHHPAHVVDAFAEQVGAAHVDGDICLWYARQRDAGEQVHRLAVAAFGGDARQQRPSVSAAKILTHRDGDDVTRLIPEAEIQRRFGGGYLAT